jgi:alpha-glucosidase/alpha-D-xyloside xylohydrolase
MSSPGKNYRQMMQFQIYFKLFILYIATITLVPPLYAGERNHVLPADQQRIVEIREAGTHCLRITIKPRELKDYLPYHPALAEPGNIKPDFVCSDTDERQKFEFRNMSLTIFYGNEIIVKNEAGDLIQKIVMNADGGFSFQAGLAPILGMGEGGPEAGDGTDWRTLPVEYDRRGRIHQMEPRPQGDAYGSRNPVPLLMGTDGWALYVNAPWGIFDLRDSTQGVFKPVQYPQQHDPHDQNSQVLMDESGIPPMDPLFNSVLDIFIFDAKDPQVLMQNLSSVFGHAVIPPRWALGYMQSHRTLENEAQMIAIVDSFRSKQIPLDAVIYLGTGFCPRGWNTRQPSFEFNPEVFHRRPEEVIADLHQRNVKVVVHIFPGKRDYLPSLQGSIPPSPGEILDRSHIQQYWNMHEPLMDVGIDGFWPDAGDWLNLFERLKRHEMYYLGSLSAAPNVRPWSLHRNGYPGIARWGGWIWSGDIESSWKTLEAQIAVGINHSLSLSPYWGSDIGGFFPSEELTGELFARWFQFGTFCPSFRSHGRTWWMRLPWGWGLSEMGPIEGKKNPLESELNNLEIEPICKKYTELRYRLMPYTYSLAWEAHRSGMPLMRALWLHYPDDETAAVIGDQYLWGPDLLVAPVYEKGATSRKVYLPDGMWYDWWTGESVEGGEYIEKKVSLEVMPIFVRAGSILPLDPVKQYTEAIDDRPMTLMIFPGANGEFTLYEDDGTTLDYQQGDASTTRIYYIDKTRILTIEPSGQEMKGNFVRKEFEIVNATSGKSRKINYPGTKIEIEL